MVERSDTTGHRSPSPSAPGRDASPVPPPALASLPGCGGPRSRGSPVVSSLRSSTTGYKLGSLRLHGRWAPGSLWMRPPAPMPRSPIRYPRVLARRLPPLTCLGIESFRAPYARIWRPRMGQAWRRVTRSRSRDCRMQKPRHAFPKACAPVQHSPRSTSSAASARDTEGLAFDPIRPGTLIPETAANEGSTARRSMSHQGGQVPWDESTAHPAGEGARGRSLPATVRDGRTTRPRAVHGATRGAADRFASRAAARSSRTGAGLPVARAPRDTRIPRGETPAMGEARP